MKTRRANAPQEPSGKAIVFRCGYEGYDVRWGEGRRKAVL